MRSAKKTTVAVASAIPDINFPIIIGWGDSNQVAETVWSLMHDSLLRGNLMLAYKDSNLQIIISKYPEGTYGISEVVPGYTLMIPSIKREYIISEVISDLEKCKVNKELIEILKNNL